MSQPIDTAIRQLQSFIRWHRPPAPSAGMGGIFPGEGTGRVNYEYLNWLNAYRDFVAALLRGHSEHELRGLVHRLESLRRGSRGGAEKALLVWHGIPASTRRFLAGSIENAIPCHPRTGLPILDTVVGALDAHITSEMRRTGGRSTYRLQPNRRWINDDVDWGIVR